MHPEFALMQRGKISSGQPNRGWIGMGYPYFFEFFKQYLDTVLQVIRIEHSYRVFV